MFPIKRSPLQMGSYPKERDTQGFLYQLGTPLFGGPFLRDHTHEAVIISEPHHRLPNGAWSGGGPFFMWRLKTEHDGVMRYPVQFVGVDWGTFTIGGVTGGVPFGKPTTVVPDWVSMDIDLQSYFPEAYAKTRPGNPVADLGQFLIELRDLPTVPFGKSLFKKKKGSRFKVTRYPLHEIPGRLKARLKDFRALGSEYLNVVFGWKPFVNDLIKMYNLWETIDKKMAQIVRENGKSIHRKATLKDESTVTRDVDIMYDIPYVNVSGSPPTWWSGRTHYTVTRTTKRRIWFSGSYRYYIPDTSSSLWTARARSALFGALPTPELLWEVLPWSWLIDWFSNVGDVMSNMSANAVDNLTMGYGFTMQHITSKLICQAHVSHPGSASPGFVWPAVDQTFRSTLQEEIKMRRGGGNPFGMGVQLDSLSTYQLSILAALGVSRSRVR